MSSHKARQIVYFDEEGRSNLAKVIRVVKRQLKSRKELRTLKVVIFTREGEGPLLAYKALAQYGTKLVAVTFPASFSAEMPDGSRFQPKISDKLRKFLEGIEVQIVVPSSLPFDPIEQMDGYSQQVSLVKGVFDVIGRGIGLCVQAVLRACDAGVIVPGEHVIAISGDSAALITASATARWLSPQGLAINEIFCKPRVLNLARPSLLPPEAVPPVIGGTELPQAPAEEKTPQLAPRKD